MFERTTLFSQAILTSCTRWTIFTTLAPMARICVWSRRCWAKMSRDLPLSSRTTFFRSRPSIHTDLKANNFLLEIDDVELVIAREQEQSPPQTFPLVSSKEGTRVNYVRSQPSPIDDEEYLCTLGEGEVRVKITDFGVACWADKISEPYTDLIQSSALHTPEVEISAGWDEQCEIWSME